MIREKRTDYLSDRDDPLAIRSGQDLPSTAASDLSPEEVREIIMAEHKSLRRLIGRLESEATRLLACSVPSAAARQATRGLALRLCAAMAAHVELENHILLPLLARADAWGPVRAERLAEEHGQQSLFLEAYTDMLSSEDLTAQSLAVTAWRLVRALREDMEAEEASVLDAAVFSPDAVYTDAETG